MFACAHCNMVCVDGKGDGRREDFRDGRKAGVGRGSGRGLARHAVVNRRDCSCLQLHVVMFPPDHNFCNKDCTIIGEGTCTERHTFAWLVSGYLRSFSAPASSSATACRPSSCARSNARIPACLPAVTFARGSAPPVRSRAATVW